jgi:hypothetical protein
MWLHFNSLPVTYNPPPVEIPKPNAYDYYLAASNAIVCKMQITEALSSIPPYHPSMYRMGPGMSGGPGAKGNMPPMPGMGGGMPGMGGGVPPMPGMSGGMPGMMLVKLPPGVPREYSLTRLYNIKEKQAVLNANAPALKLLDKAYNCKECCIPYMNDDDPRRINYEDIGLLLDLRYDLCLAEGKNWDAAMVGLKQYKVAIDFLHNCGNNQYYRAMGARKKARRNLYLLMEDLSSDQAMMLAGEMQQVLNETPTIAAIIKSIQVENLQNRADSLNERDWRTQIGIAASSEDFRSSSDFAIRCEELKMRLVGLAYSRRGYLAAMEEAYSQVDRELDKPYQSISFTVPHILNENLQNFINSEFKAMVITCTAQKAQDEMFIMSLLLKAYKAQHGKYPATLADLSPDYIKNIPPDPFAGSGTYIYRRIDDRYTLYSVGPNSKDDNGNSIYYSGAILNRNIYGDLVAGASK